MLCKAIFKIGFAIWHYFVLQKYPFLGCSPLLTPKRKNPRIYWWILQPIVPQRRSSKGAGVYIWHKNAQYCRWWWWWKQKRLVGGRRPDVDPISRKRDFLPCRFVSLWEIFNKKMQNIFIFERFAAFWALNLLWR